jgi:hypothetical protein
MHKTKAAAGARAACARSASAKSTQDHGGGGRAGGRRAACARTLSSSQKHVLFPLLHSAGLPWAAFVLHDVGSWLARAAEGRRARPRRPARFGHTRPKTSRSAGRHHQSRPKRRASEGPQAAFQKLALQGRYIQRTIRTALKAAITIYVLQGGYKEDFLTALAHIKQKQN